MKNNYSLSHLVTLLGFFYCFALNAQTMPAAQSLPYTQNFDLLAANSAIYPAGFQGWLASSAAATQFTTTGTLLTTADRSLTASSSASTSSGNIHNYNGKIGFLNGGSNLDLTIAFAFSSLLQTGIQVQYDAMVIRNPYDGTNSSRINEMILQYRVGQADAFKNLPTTAYLNTNVLQTGSGVTTPQNPLTIKVTLPSECDNQPIVQIRWISRQVSGSGSRPSFAIDNIDIRQDITAPINAVGYPLAENISGQSFDFISKINEIGKTYYVLLPSGSAEPTITQIKAGQDATGTAALQSGFLDITAASLEYVKNFTGLTLNTAYSVFSISEDSYGNIQSTVNKVDATTSNVATPTITTTVSSLDLGFSEANYSSENLSYQIQASNLTNDVVVTSSSSNFALSKDNSTFGSTLTFTAADLATAQNVYVRFTPDATNNFSGQITHESNGATSKIITLSGTGINPYIQGFNDPNVLTNSGWTQYNVAGTTNKWISTNDPRNINSGTGAVLVNGFSDTGASKDWLISPRLRLDTFSQFALLSFYSRKFYTGPSLKLMVSTDYDGKSSPETATWAEIDGKFPTVTGTYSQSQYIDLSAFKTNSTYVAWVYETISGGNTFAAEWSLDDVAITEESGYITSNPVLDFGVVNENTLSASQPFVFQGEGYGDITITAPADYQLSLDNITFQSSIVVEATEAANKKTIYVRFAPSSKQLKISGTLTVTGFGLNKQIGSFTGSSLPKEDTFDIVTYNLEFFGAPTTTYGPADKTLQLENVAKVMNKLDADVYVVQEVSSDAQIDALIQKINLNGKTFDKVTSTSWSYSWDPTSDPSFPPQKLVVLYNTQTTTVKNTRVMFKNFYDQILAGTPNLLPGYPDTQKSFFSSGRLPYMVQIETNVGGVKKLLNLVDLHARANSGTDIGKYNMRKYDAQVLKDSLDQYYPNSNLIILGDYNDDVKASVITPNPSSYKMFVDDTANYDALTLGISQAGAFSYLSSSGFLDHIMISNELTDEYIANSTAVYDPRADIANYTTTTSDHGPVIARFTLKSDNLSTIDFDAKKGFAQAYPVPATDVVNIVVKTADDKDLKLRLYDTLGRLVGGPIEIKASQESNATAVQVSNLKSGIYFYTLTENNKVVFKDKIIKK